MYQLQGDRWFRVVRYQPRQHLLPVTFVLDLKAMDKRWDADPMADKATRCTARRVLRSSQS
jgi:hypothetical protein